ncbi:hypothetical protein BDA96_07G103900 [Sorghum bicolor]|uniref:Secreted protein n=1 Tax=Sorghum bicolor TaxID=4558 RepID=A0A921QJM7_SORBI|nr:hypothetical protein BDA96_07G103900 [Sorghum bicolor]
MLVLLEPMKLLASFAACRVLIACVLTSQQNGHVAFDVGSYSQVLCSLQVRQSSKSDNNKHQRVCKNANHCIGIED